MKDRQDIDHEDLLECAIESVMNEPIPDELLGDTLAELVASVKNAANQPHTLTFIERISTMRPITKVATAAGLLLGFVGLFSLLTPDADFTSIAFADVCKQIQQARTMTWTTVITIGEQNRMICQNAYKEPGLSRVVIGVEGTEATDIQISDFCQRKALILDSAGKRATVIDLGTLGEGSVSAARNRAEDLRNLFKGTGKPLGEKEIGGRQVKGFRVTIKGMVYEIWADALTAHPVSIDTYRPGITTLMNNFTFDQELEDSLFAITPPNDYDVRQTQVADDKASEKDLVKGMQFLAMNNNDVFPPQPAMTPEIVKNLKKQDDRPGELPLRQRMEGNRAFGGMQKFLYMQNPGMQWHYAGKGVKLGTADRPIFWYKPKGSKNYRVIYADLSVKEVATEELKGFPETSAPK